MDDLRSVTRRQFLLRLAGLSGLAGGVETINHVAGGSEVQRLLRRLNAVEPRNVLDAFLNARMGELTLYYQIFFPTYLGRSSAIEVERVEQIARLCASEHSNCTHERKHRYRALPAVAAVHALAVAPDLASDARRRGDLTALFVDQLRPALDVSGLRHREVLEIGWQSAVGSLTRNSESWERFTAEPDLLDLARDTCQRFLEPVEGNQVLLWAAISAWQFLLTYEAMLRTRQTQDTLGRVRGVIADTLKQGYGGNRVLWLTMVRDLYLDVHTHSHALPEFAQAILGYRRRELGSVERQFNDLAVLSRLQMTEWGESVRAGRLSTEYVDRERLKGFPERSVSVLRNAGITAADWRRLRPIAVRLRLDAGTFSYLDSLCGQWEKQAGSAFEDKERFLARALVQLLPFRHFDDQGVGERALKGHNTLVLPSIRENAQSADLESRLNLLLIAFNAESAYTVQRLREANLTPEEQNRLAHFLSDQGSSGKTCLPEVANNPYVRESFDRLSETSLESTITFTSPARGDRTQDVGHTPLPTEGTNHMKRDSTLSAAPDDVREPRHFEIPHAGLVASAVGPCWKTIRFVDDQSDWEGFQVLDRSGYGFEMLPNNTYGIVSRHQQELLDRKAISYYEVVRKERT